MLIILLHKESKNQNSVSYYYYNVVNWTSDVIIQAKERLKSRTSIELLLLLL